MPSPVLHIISNENALNIWLWSTVGRIFLSRCRVIASRIGNIVSILDGVNAGDGKPRGLSEEITLTEPKPGGGAYSFVIRGYVWLDPFYDIKIDPLTFTLLTDCVSVGPIVPPTGISFMWLPPDAPKMNDDRGNNLGKRLDFSLGGGKSNTIFEFAWARAEVSAAANLHMPVFGFEDYFAQGPAFVPWINLDGSKAPPLVPGQTRTVQGGLKSDDGTCTASVQYTITYQLRRYGFGYY